MNMRLVKESREVMPLLITTLLFIALPYLIWHDQPGVLGYIAFGLGCAVIAASAFGNEFQHRTLPLLLSQPIPRTVLWTEKMLVRAGAIVLASFVLFACLRIYTSAAEFSWLAFIFVPLCTLCGAPLLTLLTRSDLAGAAFSIALPALLCVAAELISERTYADPGEQRSQLAGWLVVAFLTLYSASMLVMSFFKFKSLQVLDGSPGALKWPSTLETLFARPASVLPSNKIGSFRSLVVKEFRLQLMSFLMAAIFCIFAIGGVILKAGYQQLGNLVLELNLFFYCCTVPFVVGVLAVAEERGQGILD